jgi:hypothetical protein
MGINAPNEHVTPSKMWDVKKIAGMSSVGIAQRTQIYTELLVDPAYTLLFAHEDCEIYESVRDKVLNLRSTYNIYFGSAFCIAEYSEVPYEFDTSRENVKGAKVRSILDVKYVSDSIDWDKTVKMVTDNIPYKKDNDLTIRQFVQVLYNPLAEPIVCSGGFYSYRNDEYIYLFE